MPGTRTGCKVKMLGCGKVRALLLPSPARNRNRGRALAPARTARARWSSEHHEERGVANEWLAGPAVAETTGNMKNAGRFAVAWPHLHDGIVAIA